MGPLYREKCCRSAFWDFNAQGVGDGLVKRHDSSSGIVHSGNRDIGIVANRTGHRNRCDA